jgi:type I restriction enzyme, S subunit
MKYSRYPAYRDSGVEWLGDVPGHWEIKPLFALMKERQVKNVGNKVQNVLSLSYGNIVHRDVENNFGLLPESFETYQIVEPGNIILRLTDLQNDHRSLRTGRVTQSGIITSAYVCLDISNISFPLDPLFSHYLLHGYDLLKVFYAYGGGVRQSMKFEDLKRLPIVYPGVEEQRTIVTFLDRETAQIDALIAKQERLIALLQEKRLALISHVVTKGLNPDAPMKESGVEWLGEVPAHWGVVRLGKIAKLQRGHDLPEPLRKEGPYPVITSSGPFGYHNEAKAKGPGVVTGRYGTIGQVFYVESDYWPLNTSLYVINFFGNYPRFIYYMLMNLPFDMYSDKSAVPGVNRNDLHTLSMSLPPIEEQIVSSSFLDHAMARFDLLVRKAHDVIALLQERRSSLISAAVTGKIDVRTLVN